MTRLFQAVLSTAVGLGALCAAGGTAQAQFKQTDLASDISDLGMITDPHLKNTWGVAAFLGGSPFWINNQGTGTSSLFAVSGSTTITPADLPPPVPPATNFVNIPGGGVPSGPTGIVANGTSSFLIGPPGSRAPALFIFGNLNGSISAWNLATGPTATVVSGPSSTALYTGLAITPSTSPGLPMLYAANGATGAIDVFSGSFGSIHPSGFVNPSLPAGLVPFNVEDIGGTVYVSYAPAGRANQIDATAGEGVVATFNEDGTFIKNLVTADPSNMLAAPWGMAIAPAGFGPFGGDLLVGNFSFDLSEINAFNLTTGKFEGTIHVDPGAGNSAGGLWDLMFGGGGPTGNPMTLYFTDGLNGEKDGLFGAVTVPEPSTWAMMLLGFGSLALFAARRRRGALAVI